ncbi:MAG: glycogen synthase GlgA [Candidatus Omnitrophica bacterium]|nr:glycogen synthase GlgA [Candidatus Omnitrophota bacterium]MBD3269795.1 glycogen synthase GlgA [Candidatus Omnitrophota bacterium]
MVVKKNLSISFISPEALPFVKTGGLADVVGSLSRQFKLLDLDVEVFLPFYKQIKEKNPGSKVVFEQLSAKLGYREIYFCLRKTSYQGVDFYFVDNEDFFHRDNLYGTSFGDYPDNLIRFAFFSKAVLVSLIALNSKPDIIHSNDWQTALVPFYMRKDRDVSKFFGRSRSLFTIHNLAYQGIGPSDTLPLLGIDYDFFTPGYFEFYGKINLMKAGIIFSEVISTVSKGYAREILTEEFGCGLQGLLQKRKNDIYGILNGADYSLWDPAKDNYIAANYNQESLSNKYLCKKDLLHEVGLDYSYTGPLLGVISRLAKQKGIDVLISAMHDIVRAGYKIIILGTGEERYQQALWELSRIYPDKIAVRVAFDDSLAHKIEAGCDLFLMPSEYEPCGLNQMYSLKYATPPVVRAVGGLDDTVIDYTQSPLRGNGFKFRRPEAGDFLNALHRAVDVYNNKDKWRELTVRAMSFDFSWEVSAGQYVNLYRKIIKGES